MKLLTFAFLIFSANAFAQGEFQIEGKYAPNGAIFQRDKAILNLVIDQDTAAVTISKTDQTCLAKFAPAKLLSSDIYSYDKTITETYILRDVTRCSDDNSFEFEVPVRLVVDRAADGSIKYVTIYTRMGRGRYPYFY